MSGLAIEILDDAAAAGAVVDPADDLLALVLFGARSAADPDHVFRLPLPRLDGAAGEAWRGSGTVRRESVGRLRVAVDGTHWFGSVEVEAAGKRLEDESRRAYEELLRASDRAGCPHVLRAWNAVAHINRFSAGEERYRLFCKGRAEAYALLWGEGFERRLPSCSAVGSHTESLSVHMLAASIPGTSIENPRQVSAYRYPEIYGPKSPSFARGLVAPSESGGWIFVSGTASIVGHESVHRGDPAAQTEETMRNVEEVLDAGDCPGTGGPLGARLHALRVYVRRREDVGAIRETLDRILGCPVPTVWLLADVCREELLVEIEGIGRGRSASSAGR